MPFSWHLNCIPCLVKFHLFCLLISPLQAGSEVLRGKTGEELSRVRTRQVLMDGIAPLSLHGTLEQSRPSELSWMYVVLRGQNGKQAKVMRTRIKVLGDFWIICFVWEKIANKSNFVTIQFERGCCRLNCTKYRKWIRWCDFSFLVLNIWDGFACGPHPACVVSNLHVLSWGWRKVAASLMVATYPTTVVFLSGLKRVRESSFRLEIFCCTEF